MVCILTGAQGILGYSEGATVAATLVLEEQRRVREEGRTRRLKVRSHVIALATTRSTRFRLISIVANAALIARCIFLWLATSHD